VFGIGMGVPFGGLVGRRLEKVNVGMQVSNEDENESGSGSMQEDEKWGLRGIDDGFMRVG